MNRRHWRRYAAAFLAFGYPAFTASLAQADEYLVIANDSIPGNLAASIQRAGGSVVTQFPQIGIVVVESSNPNFATSVKGVRVVPNLGVQLPKSEVYAADALPQPPSTGDDDFFFDLQWGHTAVHSQEAWAAGQRGQGARVFVLDTGFDLDHPDLAPNFNLSLAKSFVPGSATAAYELPDVFSHGTHVAGIVAAADNGFGTIGVAPRAEIVPVKVLSDAGSGAFSWIIGGILYAADNGADVINMSLGAVLPQGNGRWGQVPLGENLAPLVAELRVAVNRAITYAFQKGATVIVSAGNEGLDFNDPSTASYIDFNGFASHAISISAVAPSGWAIDPSTELTRRASYTNVGPTVDFAAPGGDVDPNVTGICTVARVTVPCFVFDLVFSTGNNGWFWAGGTSMAAPHAAGVAALIVGENGGSMHPAQVKAAMRSRALDLGKRGVDDVYGYGLATSGY